VVIPARNEEEDIPKCLDSVVNQDYPSLEVLVVDDASTDQTAEIVQRMQKQHNTIRLIRGQEPPQGWAGKTHALYQGVQEATGDYFLFLDADGRLFPSCITQVVKRTIEHNAGLLTLIPRFETVRFWEKVVLPVIGHLIFTLPLTRVNKPNSKLTLVSGPFMLFQREAYQAIGGIERFKDSIVEDLALGRAIKEAGYRLYLSVGHELFTARKYKSLREIWNGFTKNFFVGLDRKLWQAGLLAAAIFVVFVFPWLSVPALLAYLWLHGPSPSILTALLLGSGSCLLTLLTRGLLWKSIKLDATHALLHPLGALVVIGILANSTLRILGGKGVSWKGRAYLAGRDPS
jgi:glycosyltransferase involved in cell wall biosynthesis